MTQTLISVEEAWRIIQAKSCERPSEWVSLEQAVGAIAVEDWKCDRDQPPFNRVMMDGMAIRFADFESGKRSFRIGGLHAAGADPNEVSMDSEALEIMTGAALPNGWDTVIPYEMLQISQTEATCLVSAIKEGQHVHLSGTDFKENQMICMAGRRIGPAEIGIAASIGLSQIRVEKKYKVLIVATGNELVAVNTIPLPHQIRMSNVHALAAAVYAAIGVKADLMHVIDEEGALINLLHHSFSQYDLILLSGAVSMGKLDFVPSALTQTGATTHLHGIAQRPGKPMLFASKENCLVFALPGNPVSTLVCWARYVRPFLTKQIGYKANTDFLENGLSMTRFVPVTRSKTTDQLRFSPMSSNGSGDFLGLLDARGFVELSPNRDTTMESPVFWEI